MPFVILPFESASDSIDTGVMTLGEGDAEERKRLKGVFISLFPIWAEVACSGKPTLFSDNPSPFSGKSSPANIAAQKSSRNARGSFSRWHENRFLLPFCAHISITTPDGAVGIRGGCYCKHN